MSYINVDSASFDTSAEAVVDVAGEYATGTNTPSFGGGGDVVIGGQLNGTGDHTAISNGEFMPGLAAQEVVTENAGLWSNSAINTHQSIEALSAALFGIRDIFAGTDSASAGDVANAVNFMFTDPSATTPGGLPGYIDPEATTESMEESMENDSAEGAESGGDSSPAQLPTTTSTQVYDDAGCYLYTHHETTSPGADGSAGQHKIEYPDGSVDYYHTNADGERYGDFSVDPQDTITTGESMDEQTRLLDEALEEGLPEDIGN
ncbi:hypothetical protein BAY61_22460 [Prauserella marina]|uniref:Uncharacterized protein n=1 Tax=Prauserella marina TaxID=530584 RepID=A0A222VUA0_9PSEU|nr:hypothetical protein [Prauserella marina]ASR37303.1 hypothetical protein BAY61_22460 [Prauserella marina]PWV74845.1 hypothetical protein DES30_107243 [Prauserella marina]SDD39218.1 hypothetical protein SAMN05421630_1088 [Prauserella marina]